MDNFEEFKNTILQKAGFLVKEYGWRKGQSVFNYIDHTYNVARTVQYIDNIDCFYNDDNIDEFIEKAYNHVRQNSARNDKSQ